MCGICGYSSKALVPTHVLKDMTDIMSFRGPDDEGQNVFQDNGGLNSVGLGHRRLSIVDLKPTGHQPMPSASQRSWIVFNGEIYNYLELKKELNKDYSFKSECDTEVLLAGYEKWGIDGLLLRLRGMFAFAICDSQQHLLHLARDRMGEKPLYYYFDGVSFVFASSLAPIMKFPFAKLEINKEVLPSYLSHGYIAAPNSIFRNTFKIQAGEHLVFDGNLVTKTFYWNILDEYRKFSQKPIHSKQKAIESLDLLFNASVKEQLVADVPVGCFLSGGVDSSAVTGIASSLKPGVKTFSIGFEDPAYDESKFSTAVASYLKTTHENETFGEDQLLSLINEIPHFYDEPFADSSQLPTMEVSSLAKKRVTVVLSGDGGDELFCGYDSYPRMKKYPFYQFIARSCLFLTKSRKFVARHPTVSRHLKTYAYSDLRHYPSQLLNPDNQKLIFDAVGMKPDQSLVFQSEASFHVKDRRRSHMLLDMQTYLPDCIMMKVDHAGMKYSLESRAPLLDWRIVLLSFQIPLSMNLKGKSGKRVLKTVCGRYVDFNLINQKKHGFSVPIRKWLQGPLNKDLLRLSNPDFINKQGIFDPQGIDVLVRSYLTGNENVTDFNVWSFFVFQKWYEYYEKMLSK